MSLSTNLPRLSKSIVYPSLTNRAKRAIGLSSELDVLIVGVFASFGNPVTPANLFKSKISALSISCSKE